MRQPLRPRALLALPLFASLQIAAGASSPAWTQSSSGFLARGAVSSTKPASPQELPATQQNSLGGCPVVHRQSADLLDGLFSDSALPQSIADDITLTVNTSVCVVTICGAFGPGNHISPGTIDLIVHVDSGGAPGPVVYSELGITPQLALNGDTMLGSLNTYFIDIFPTGILSLVGGVTYWFEIYYNSEEVDDNWVWLTAQPDPDSGQLGSLLSNQAPGTSWINLPASDLAISVSGLEENSGSVMPICSPANTNSRGISSTLTALGSIVAADNNLTLLADDLPFGETGYLLNSMNTQVVPVSDGLLCIGPGFGRHVTQVGSSGMFGQIFTVLNLTSLPRSSGPEPVLGGQTWYFQLWYRDGNASNFTDALQINFE